MHPSILILTKIKRWANILTSTYPPLMHKAKTDFEDILFLLSWQADRNLTISMQLYKAQHPDRPYRALYTLAVYLRDKRMLEPWALLKKVVTAEDWQRMGLGQGSFDLGEGGERGGS